MEQHAHAARRGSLASMPLTLFTQRAGATVCNPSGIDEIAGLPPGSVRRAPGQRCFPAGQHTVPSGWRVKATPRKAASFEEVADHWWAIALLMRLLSLPRGQSGGKLRRLQRGRGKLMAQFQTEIPHPLRDNLPGFLSGGGMATPAVGVEFLVFVGKLWLKGAAMLDARATTSAAVKPC